MFANVKYATLHDTLGFYDVPDEFCNIIMAQVAGNAFDICTIKGEHFVIDLRKGIVEGSPISVLLVGLLLSRFLLLLRSAPSFSDTVVKFPGDAHQAELTLDSKGWVDDWIVFGSSIPSLENTLRLWQNVLATMGWEIHSLKTEFLCASVFEESLRIGETVISPQ